MPYYRTVIHLQEREEFRSSYNKHQEDIDKKTNEFEKLLRTSEGFEDADTNAVDGCFKYQPEPGWI